MSPMIYMDLRVQMNSFNGISILLICDPNVLAFVYKNKFEYYGNSIGICLYHIKTNLSLLGENFCNEIKWKNENISKLIMIHIKWRVIIL